MIPITRKPGMVTHMAMVNKISVSKILNILIPITINLFKYVNKIDCYFLIKEY